MPRKAPRQAAPANPRAEDLSVITCDMEGRLQTFGAGAERLFGYKADEVVGRKRVSLFSPGEVVLGHVPAWLKAARETGAFETDTVFVRKDGTHFSARIRITPTFKGGKSSGEQVGYCGVTRAIDADPDAIMPKTSVATRIFKGVVIGRLPFLTASLIPALLAAAWVAAGPSPPAAFPWGLFGLVMLGTAMLHLAANTFNDYFDWTSGTDEENNDYFLPFSGGSRSIELGLITPRKLFAVASAALAAAAACGVALALLDRPLVLAFGAVGALSGFFYTAPPVRLAARRGLGELFVGLNFGPLMTAGAAYAMRGSLVPEDFLIGIPMGLLTTAILWVNEIPDTPADVRAGKVHLVAALGVSRARWGYVSLLVAAFGAAAGLALAGIVPMGSLLMLLALPIAAWTGTKVVRHYADRSLAKASAGTIGLHLLAGLLTCAGLLWLA
ncbi:MAG TPA: UbiA family prenyltransferase [Candidatus Thermoplasmatota archaeon]|nr:UbiA family prenyltransferase [Candidatus Thermoplasmatota archaeon]